MVKTSTRIVGALALAAVLVSNGPASAAQPGGAMDGDLSSNRTSADVVVPVDCDPVPQNSTDTKSASVSVKIYQSVGRLLNIGTGSAAPTCTGQPVNVTVTVHAIDGLKFQPGPATVLITLTEQSLDAVGTQIGAATVTETGARINLHP